MKYYTIDSRSEPLPQILGDINQEVAENLASQGWQYPKQILSNWEKAMQTIAPPFQEHIRQRLDMASHLHMGSVNARLLENAGVFSLETLAKQDPDGLFRTLNSVNKRASLRSTPLLKRRVIAWIEGAKRQSPLY
jgi:hypothetical protein